jgi:hypothetical protein
MGSRSEDGGSEDRGPADGAEGHGPEGHGPEGHGPESHGPEGHGHEGHAEGSAEVRDSDVGKVRGGRVPPWDYTFSGVGFPCLMCDNKTRTSIVLTGPRVKNPGPRFTHGICEACAVHLYWAWHERVPDADLAGPDELRKDVERVKVVLSRLKTVDGKSANPEVTESYQFALVIRPDGGLDLPSADLLRGETCVDAAVRALKQHGAHTWPCFVEPLYAALSPRGRLARVMLAVAYTTWTRDKDDRLVAAPAESGQLKWRDRPPWEEAPDLCALYLALRDVWPLRIWKHVARDPHPSEITTCVRRAAAEYIYMQQDLRADKRGVDTSAAEILRRSMSDDEKMVDRRLGDVERGQAEIREQEAQVIQGPAEDGSTTTTTTMANVDSDPELSDDVSDQLPDDLFAGEPEESQ